MTDQPSRSTDSQPDPPPPIGIERADAELHDAFLTLSSLTHDGTVARMEGVTTLPFGLRLGRYRVLLEVRNVSAVAIQDEARCDSIDVHDLSFDGRAVVLEGRMPVVIRFVTENPVVRFEIAKHPHEVRRWFRWKPRVPHGLPPERAAAVRAVVYREPGYRDAMRALGAFLWDSEHSVEFDNAPLIDVLEAVTEGRMTAHDAVEWAEFLELRDDITFLDRTAVDVVFEIANPDLSGPLTPEHSRSLVARLGPDPRRGSP